MNIAFKYIAVDALIFNFLFACFIILLWYPVRFNQWKNKIPLQVLMAHFLLSCLVIFTWISIGYLIMYLFFSSDNHYWSFFNISLWWKIIEGFLFYSGAILIYYLLVYIEQLNEKTVNEIRLNQLIKDGELNMLKSQINPHFLFNGLNSVNYLIINHPDQAQKMLISLSDYLRYAVLSTNHTYSSLKDEMENINRYLSIEKLRFGDKLIYTSDIDSDCLSVQIPAMILQPLLENAIKHGVYESLQTVCIHVKIIKDNQYLIFSIDNDFDSENVLYKKGSGTGIKNIKERLRLLYGTDAVLQTKSDNEKFIAILKIPIEKT